MLLVYKSSNLQGIQWSFIIRLFFLYKSMYFKLNDFNNKNCLCGNIYISEPHGEKETELYSATGCAGLTVPSLLSLDNLYSQPLCTEFRFSLRSAGFTPKH